VTAMIALTVVGLTAVGLGGLGSGFPCDHQVAHGADSARDQVRADTPGGRCQHRSTPSRARHDVANGMSPAPVVARETFRQQQASLSSGKAP
jgi:hypothetical protein